MAECNGFELTELPQHSDLKQVARPGVPYFYAELPNKEAVYCRIKKDSNFPLHFGREVLASDRILDMNDRVDWKDCQIDFDEEVEVAKKVRQQFSKFDLDNDD